MSKIYDDIVEYVENSTTVEELQIARTRVANFRMQTGGSNKDLKYQIDTLYVTIMNKEKEILKLWT